MENIWRIFLTFLYEPVTGDCIEFIDFMDSLVLYPGCLLLNKLSNKTVQIIIKVDILFEV